MLENSATSNSLSLYNPYIILPLIGVILGWILGLISTFAIQFINRKKEINDFKRGLYTEFVETSIFLTLLVHMLYERVGGFNRDLISWCHSKLKENENALPDETSKRVINSLREMLTFSNEDLAKACAIRKALADDSKRALDLKKIHTPFLDLKISNLPLLKENLRNSIIKIHIKIKKMNEDIKRHSFYFEKTFDANITSGNYEIISNNIKENYNNIARQAQITVGLISEAQKELEK